VAFPPRVAARGRCRTGAAERAPRPARPGGRRAGLRGRSGLAPGGSGPRNSRRPPRPTSRHQRLPGTAARWPRRAPT
jgi:hypothetical protein